VQPGSLWGADEEFIASRQLDNLASCHAALTALTAVNAPAATTVAALFDHEEVGSESAAGAGGSFVGDVLARIGLAQGLDGEDRRRALANSFFVSADMAHAYNPNFPAAYEPEHKVMVNGGPVIKTNASQRYTTDAATAARFMALWRDHRHADHRAAEEGPAQRAGCAARGRCRPGAAAARRPRLHAALRAGARGPGHAGQLGLPISRAPPSRPCPPAASPWSTRWASPTPASSATSCARAWPSGVAALVTDGVVRDLAGVLATGLPVWCQGTAAPASVAGLTFVGWQEPVGCGGVAVFPTTWWWSTATARC
jgi:hypothetical protein